MNVQQLREYYGVENNSQLAKKIKKVRSVLTKWEKEGIPPRTQATFEVLTKGQLKADLNALNA
ncbi:MULTISPECIES: hypothetical protein [Acinetobacter calcoaceticus/baumannii complex]|uniref:hypothetical protein n=1 Tax=Acinetobacter calcoaceticus/baumannii complex TaxID=909768 RepID=UPI000D641486|nr:hypothetical protein [Acinetobacter baumannii]EKV0973141.1 hypothetical protein [Acinetobacter baumannii]EKV2255026.1 hypothetical protein [Acinetobacter baumannii]EKX9915340.1 hypothetical protein [Acinetobacter baumannii]MBJ9493408.1 hypothetical protein [Acinetobacter baumannii]MDC4595723.1 hypothetical protein [Acinetobacter baumannii]